MKKRMLSLAAAAMLASVLTVPAAAATADRYSPVSTMSYGGHTYAIYNYDTDWDEAKMICENLGGYLVTVTTEDEQNALTELFDAEAIMRSYWMGGYKDTEWHWITGEEFAFTNWADNEPNGGNDVVMQIFSQNSGYSGQDYRWDDTWLGGDKGSGIKTEGFICEWGDVVEVTAISPNMTSEVTEFNGHTYAVYNDAMTWYEAKAACEAVGGYLATVTSAEEEAFIEELIQRGTQYFYWLGGTDEAEEGTWTWITGEKWEYTNWDSGEPSDKSGTDGTSEDYLTIYRSMKSWNDLQNEGDNTGDYVMNKLGYICEWGDVITPDTLPEGQVITSFNSVVSDWAKDEIEEAYQQNLLPAVLVGGNLTTQVNRAEFAAVAVKLYESMSQTAASAGDNPFTDIAGNSCEDDILKAYNLYITVGTAPTLFSPDELITREQVATMLTRAYKSSEFDGWTLDADADYLLNYMGVEKFADDDEISDYAKESVYFMVKWGIINGIGNNKFAPKGNILFEEGYGYATREEALVIALRTAKYL